jgi:cell division protein FtsW
VWVYLIVLVLVLISTGLLMVYSSSSVMALKKYSDSMYFVKRQLVSVVLGLGALLVAAHYPYKRYKSLAPVLLLLAIISLVIVLIPGIGRELNGARRWFRLAGFSLQPAEYAKIAWIIYLSSFLERKQDRIRQFTVGFLPPIIMCGVFGILLLLEPDFGTSLVIGILTASMLAVGGVPWHHLAVLAPGGLVVFYKFVYGSPYRWERITAFLNPWIDPLDSGYQLIQAWIAVGSGGLLGKGLGAGQQKLFYLPEPYTDFILAVIGEELGFTGICFIVGLFLLLFWTGIHIAQRARDYFGALLALGLTLMLSLQAFINMAVVLGLFPTKGLPLPFVSYGGSAFIANCIAVGILVNIARKCVK